MRDATREARRGEDCNVRSGTGPVGWKRSNQTPKNKKTTTTKAHTPVGRDKKKCFILLPRSWPWSWWVNMFITWSEIFLTIIVLARGKGKRKGESAQN